MPESSTGPLLHPCPSCSTMLDVSDEQPFAQVHCPSCGQSMRVRRHFGDYELQEILGTGGMGAVYKAIDRKLNRPVAIKVLRREFSSNPEFLAKFENEARITASINHPHVVKVYFFGEDHGIYYIVMEIVDKGSLDDLMHQLKRVPEGQALEVAIQVAMGLQAAHRVGLIHRDVKPGNILFADSHTAKIVDFGLALLLAEQAELEGEIWGTPYYIAPEKLRHEPEDFHSDMYSLGGSLFHAISGEPPFEAETPSLIARKHLDDEPQSIQEIAPDVSIATAFVLDKTLKKAPEERYQSYEELIEHLTYARTKLMEASGRSGFQIFVNKALEHGVGIILTALVLALAAFGYSERDTLFKKAADTEQSREKKGPSPEMEMKYQQGQKFLLAGNFAKAQETFQELEQKDVPQPLMSWIRFHEALCEMLENHEREAGAVFKKMSGGVFTDNPADGALANFFTSASKLLDDNKPVPVQEAGSYDTPNQEAIALFAFGLKDWNLGDFDQAKRFFEKFLISEPKDQYTWIADFKPLAERYLADYRLYSPIAEKLAGATDVAEKSKLFTEVTKQKGNLQTLGPMVQRFEKIAADLQAAGATLLADQPPPPPEGTTPPEAPAPVPAPPEQPKPESDLRKEESKMLEAARAKYLASCKLYNFAEAKNPIAAMTLTEADFVQQKNALLRRAELLQAFKTTLINDLNTVGYSGAIYKKNTIALPPGAHRATDAQISTVTQFGSLPATWSEIAPMSMLTMADYFSKRAANAKIAADRLWLMGVFAMELGMEREGNSLLDRAAQAKPAYREERAAIFPSNAPSAEMPGLPP